MRKIQSIIMLVVTLLCSVGIPSGMAQLNPLSTQYYTNLYLANPAMAGKEAGFRGYVVGKLNFANLPGSPVTQNLSGSYGFKRVGVGIYVNSQKAGLQRDIRALSTFAYHLPLDLEGTNRLSFGLSLGFMQQRLATADINGNLSDVGIGQYNDRPAYIDGDFGVAYTGKHLSVEAAMPNLKSGFQRDAITLADVTRFYSAVSYRIALSASRMELEPKVVYRDVSVVDNIWDAGARVSFEDRQLFFTALYHSNRSSTFGLEFEFKKKYRFGSFYNTSPTSVRSYTTPGFELNLGLRL